MSLECTWPAVALLLPCLVSSRSSIEIYFALYENPGYLLDKTSQVVTIHETMYGQ